MIKKLLLVFSFVALVTIAINNTAYAAQEGEKIVISEELTKLNNLYKEGVITEEEFSKAKSILLNPDSTKSKKKIRTLTDILSAEGILGTNKGTTAAERKRLEDAAREEEKALKKQLREEKAIERERVKAERKRIVEEKRIACSADPKSEECKKAKSQVTSILEKIKIFAQEQTQEMKQERKDEKQAIKERNKKRKERLKKERELKEQASLEEQKRIRAEKAARNAERKTRNAERKKRKAEWKKACSDDPESQACKEGKPSEKIKNVLKKIEKKLGG